MTRAKKSKREAMYATRSLMPHQKPRDGFISSGELAAITGLTQSQIQNWTAAGWIAPDRFGVGPGVYRQWSPEDVEAIKLIAKEYLDARRAYDKICSDLRSGDAWERSHNV